MSQRLFWINVSLFMLLPLLIILALFLPREPALSASLSIADSPSPDTAAALAREEMPAAGKIEIISSGSKIPQSSDRQDGPGPDVVLSGRIGYFNGKTNLQGRELPDQPHRFLAGELLHIDIYLPFEPREMTVTINDIERRLAGVPGRRYYWTSFILPAWPATLDWDGSRLLAPYQLQVMAVSRSDPDLVAMTLIDDIELTGSVWSIVHVQAN